MADLPPIPAWFDCTRHTAEREAQVAALAEAAGRYLNGHHAWCASRPEPTPGDAYAPCNCGYETLRAALAPFQPKPKEDTHAE